MGNELRLLLAPTTPTPGESGDAASAGGDDNVHTPDDVAVHMLVSAAVEAARRAASRSGAHSEAGEGPPPSGPRGKAAGTMGELD
mmetsp:Transcript_31565/g.96628  ORF Transcript_31565/g.96628 Transcript_31565/m.96628 type:complete len:85 (+) Transcript_31565:1512-1766(+)